ncbi:MAG: 2,3-bisphosphoglycerate-independent phosphoglycerate mutase [Chitinophagales bacterium]|nr:2,3-bisphosphoglycerate-independent phosphoglycerate mutase [Chitinophagales bacterium]
MRKKVILIIMDGWGKGTNPEVSAIAKANTPFIDSLYRNYPNSELVTHSEFVGLPMGQMGNSEVGHLNIGAGRVVYQELLRVNVAIQTGELKANKTLTDTFAYCLAKNKPLHLIGLVSDGGVHSHINHVKALCDYAKDFGLNSEQVFVHAFTDGRDCDPKSGLGFLKELEEYLTHSAGRLATVCGRYYAMDRDKRWERVKLAYDLLVKGEGNKTTDAVGAVAESYANGVTDEFVKPIVRTNNRGEAIATIKEGDAVICFNFRTDRCREITTVLTQKDMPEHGMQTIPLYYVTMTNYDDTFKNVKVIFDNDKVANTLGEVIAKQGLTQVRIAETEKYPHVTFFFSGGREATFEGEKRILVPSPKVATYDLQPEMSAPEVTQKIVEEIEANQPDFVCLNFANPDMVGHTGVFSAAIKACETIDGCVQRVVETALKYDYILLITADHGNADYMINEDGSPNTAHTKNPVPLFLVGNNLTHQLKKGKLADLAPTILKLMEIEKPDEMTGESLI